MTRKRVGLFLASMILWILLAGIAVEELILGVVVSTIIALLFGKSSMYTFNIKWVKRSILFLVMYVPIFVIELIRANIDVMVRVLDPKLPINPGFVRVPTELKGDFAKLTLANSITLTPGTITLDVDDSNLYVHWIDVKQVDDNVDRHAVSGPFERLLGRVFK
jgi:multicomponent Na+:H+ antiporter subunit E